jgi:hypothetical protein
MLQRDRCGVRDGRRVLLEPLRGRRVRVRDRRRSMLGRRRLLQRHLLPWALLVRCGRHDVHGAE